MKESYFHFRLPFQGHEDRDFILALTGSLVFYTCIALLMHVVQIPERPRGDFERIPPHIAKLILKAPKPSTPINTLESPQMASVTPKTQEPPKVEEKPPPKDTTEQATQKPKAPVPSPSAQQEARLRLEQEAKALQQRNREIAMQSGLLRLLTKEDKNQPSVQDLTKGKSFQKVLSPVSGLQNLQEQASKNDRQENRVIEANGSGGIDDLIAMLKEQGGGLKAGGELKGLGKKQVTQIESPIKIKGAGGEEATRSYESIREVVDTLTGWIRFIYNRSLRDNPTLKGTITLEFEIIPNGEVVSCRVASSTVNDPALEDQLVRRFLQLRFSPIGEGINTVIYPITLLPSG